MSLNETKLCHETTLEITGYEILRKDRDKRGGGVAILVKAGFKYNQIPLENFENEEIIGVEVVIINAKVNIFSIYVPPNKTINNNLIQTLSSRQNTIIFGDFNCHSTMWYCKKVNKNGEILEGLIETLNLIVHNRNTPTHRGGNILDLLITSANLADKLKFLKVCSNDMNSDHFPIISVFDLPINLVKSKSNITKRIVNWNNYTKELDKLCVIYNSSINNMVIDVKEELKQYYANFKQFIHESYEKSSFMLTKKVRHKTLPNYLVQIIHKRQEIAKQVAKEKQNGPLKTHYNSLTKLVSEELNALRQNKLLKVCESLERDKKGSSEYWKKIKIIGKLTDAPMKDNCIPKLIENGIEYDTNMEKAKLFSLKLSKIFSESTNSRFNTEHKIKIEKILSEKNSNLFVNAVNEAHFNEPFKMNELNDALKCLETKSSPGPDKVTNTHLKKASSEARKLLLLIVNKSWLNKMVLDEWKVAQITMIPKKNDEKSNPDNYRPISLTNSIIKLIEKLVKNRLIEYLERNQLLSIYQSGFRKKRQTTDNILYLTQRIYQGIHEKKTSCGIIFDIMKAFDKVWHNGLIYKLSELNLPSIMGYWIVNFLSNRKFQVRIGDKISNEASIETGVPQGAILSPILFIIFINDILKTNEHPNGTIESLLFADDLFSFVQDTNENRVKIQMQRYLNSLEKWFNEWRLCVAPKKCNFMVFNKRKRKTKYDFEIFGEKISRAESTRYLGVELSENLNYKQHTENIRTKCLRLLNVLKCLSTKKWSLDKEGLLMVYKSLIRSNMEYAAPILVLKQTNINRIKGIQYHALRIIFKKPIMTSSKELHELADLGKFEDRLYNLSYNYLLKNEDNPLIKILLEKNQVDYESPIQRIMSMKQRN
jgi:chorismate mutase